MPPLVFDFPDIASRLRKDEFYTPRKEETEEYTVGIDLAAPPCPDCHKNDQVRKYTDTTWGCYNCFTVF